MKVRASIKKLCAGCRVVQYNKKNYIRCLQNPRHKQRQKFSTMKITEQNMSVLPLPVVQQMPITISKCFDVKNMIEEEL